VTQSYGLAIVGVGVVADLGQPDALLAFGGFSINLLPILMAAFSLGVFFGGQNWTPSLRPDAAAGSRRECRTRARVYSAYFIW
jgi:hypothetical protein